MSNQKTLLIAMILFPLMVGLACTCGLLPSGRDEVVELEEALAVAETAIVVQEEGVIPDPTDIFINIEPGEELILLDTMWVQEENEVFVAFTIKNQLPDQALKDIEYKIILLDAEGEEIRSAGNRIHWLYPEQIDAIAYRNVLPSDSDPVDEVLIEYAFSDMFEPDRPENPLVAEKVKIWEGWRNPIITGIIKNNSNSTFTNFRSDILCYDAEGNIIGGGTSNHRFILGQSMVGFNDDLYIFGEIDYVKVFPKSISGAVEIKADSDISGQISILDYHFYVTRTGGLNGGVVIQNNLTDTVLKDSYILVTYFDAEGFVTTIGYREVRYLMPGSTLGVMPSFLTQSNDAEPVDFELLILPGEPADDYELQEDFFVVNSAALKEDDENYVTINYKNGYTKTVSEMAVFILLYNDAGEIIGGAVNKTDSPTPPGGSGSVDIYVFYSRDHSVEDIQVWLTPSLFTKFE